MTKIQKAIIGIVGTLTTLLAITGVVSVVFFGGYFSPGNSDSMDTDVEDDSYAPAAWSSRPSTEESLKAALDNQGFAGLVERVSPDEIVLAPQKGESRRFALSAGVVIYRGFIRPEKIALNDLKVGASVQLSYSESSGKVSEIWVD